MADNEFELTHRDRLGNHTPASNRTHVEAFNTSTEADRSALNQLGKNPILKRNFGFLSILGFSSTALICWESMLIVLDQGLKNGGPSGVIYGFILVWIGSLATFASLTELASMAPVAGGQYHWVSMMAPARSQQIVSYIEGWLTVAGWQALCAGAAFLSAELLQALVSFTDPQYTPKPYQTMLLIWAVVALSVSINAQGGTFLPRFEGLILISHILGYFGLLIPLIVLSNHQPTSAVFNNFSNGGNWSTKGLSFMIGLNGAVFVFAGADGSLHMSEEIRNAIVIVPRALVFSYFYNGLMGLAMLIALLYSYSDLNILQNPPQKYAFIEIFYQVTHSVSGTAVMVSFTLIMQFCATVSVQTSASRMLWSFSRDMGVPGWRQLQKVHPRSTLPIYCIAMTSICTCLLSLITLGSSVALDDVLSITAAGLYASYLVALSFLLYRRCTGGIEHHADGEILTNTGGAKLVWGPWHLPGMFGKAVNAFACAYLILVWLFAFWPTEVPVTGENMNYSILIFGTVISFSVVYYFAKGNKEYTGPVIEEIKQIGHSRED
ncbi:hypothetical protein Q9189_002417 [Teloschistes chrysophthalmus]